MIMCQSKPRVLPLGFNLLLVVCWSWFAPFAWNQGHHGSSLKLAIAGIFIPWNLAKVKVNTTTTTTTPPKKSVIFQHTNYSNALSWTPLFSDRCDESGKLNIFWQEDLYLTCNINWNECLLIPKYKNLAEPGIIPFDIPQKQDLKLLTI